MYTQTSNSWTKRKDWKWNLRPGEATKPWEEPTAASSLNNLAWFSRILAAFCSISSNRFLMSAMSYTFQFHSEIYIHLPSHTPTVPHQLYSYIYRKQKERSETKKTLAVSCWGWGWGWGWGCCSTSPKLSFALLSISGLRSIHCAQIFLPCQYTHWISLSLWTAHTFSLLLSFYIYIEPEILILVWFHRG